MAFWEMFATQNFYDGKKWRNKGEKLNLPPKEILNPQFLISPKLLKRNLGKI
ncbi:hypothetical protein V1L52_08195 [Treponema sp. HNW]|uniref:hypothetical protein n=1 Tax=Treponema sp. HNW TaxID=3116654 RepID=UPI003D148A57